jgi:hypothetical protein
MQPSARHDERSLFQGEVSFSKTCREHRRRASFKLSFMFILGLPEATYNDVAGYRLSAGIAREAPVARPGLLSSERRSCDVNL